MGEGGVDEAWWPGFDDVGDAEDIGRSTTRRGAWGVRGVVDGEVVD